MRKIMIMMSVLMGFTMSLCLSLLGTGMSGHFTVSAWLFSFGVSFVISLIIGFIVPMKKVSDAACNKAGIIPESFKGNLLSSLISNVIYTPVITIAMVVLMVGGAARQMREAGAPESAIPSIQQTLVPSLVVSFIVGYIIIFIVQPLYIRMLLKKMLPPGNPGMKENQ